jgi:hypothetical protein
VYVRLKSRWPLSSEREKGTAKEKRLVTVKALRCWPLAKRL